jgi:2-haloacid dehalogenase
MKSAFINRRSRPFGQTPYQPDVIFKDMGELADMLCSH